MNFISDRTLINCILQDLQIKFLIFYRDILSIYYRFFLSRFTSRSSGYIISSPCWSTLNTISNISCITCTTITCWQIITSSIHITIISTSLSDTFIVIGTRYSISIIAYITITIKRSCCVGTGSKCTTIICIGQTFINFCFTIRSCKSITCTNISQSNICTKSTIETRVWITVIYFSTRYSIAYISYITITRK